MAKKILIADQSDTVREIAENLLRKKGFEVISASDGVETLELLRTADADLAFINSALPEIDGYEISRQIKSEDRTRDIKTVLLLSTSEIVNQRQLLSSMADSTLNKPFSPQDLVEKAFETLEMELEDDGAGENGSAESVISAQELDLTDEERQEIDFGSVFSDEKPSGDDGHESIDEIFLAEETQDHSIEQSTNILSPSTETKKETANSEPSHTPAAPKPGDSGAIHLADDQYGLEGPLEEPEVGNPHDYNWFIREMKKDLGDDSSEVPRKSVSGQSSSETATDKINTVSGHVDSNSIEKEPFEVDILGSARIAVPENPHGTDIRKEQNLSNAVKTELVKESERLSLAERLLVKEVAHRLADKMLDKFTAEDLRTMIAEVLTSLKKM